MKKTIAFFILTWLFFSATILCHSQEKFKAGISMGQVYPLNDFKSVDLSSVNAGFAQTGFTLNVDGDYFLHNRFSLTFRFHLGNAPINQPFYKDRLNIEMKDYFTEEDTVQYDINYWQWVSPLIGCKFNYPVIQNKVYVEAGIFTGISFIQIPDQNVVFNDKTNKRIIISQNIENTDISIPFSVNAGFRFKINESVQLKVNAEYYQSKASYNHVSYYQNENPSEQTEIKKYGFNVPIQTLNATIGLVYCL